MNDFPARSSRAKMAPPDMIIDDFEERLRQIADGKPQVMGIALHHYLVGQRYRMWHSRRMLEHITARLGDIWITTVGAI